MLFTAAQLQAPSALGLNVSDEVATGKADAPPLKPGAEQVSNSVAAVGQARMKTANTCCVSVAA